MWLIYRCFAVFLDWVLVLRIYRKVLAVRVFLSKGTPGPPRHACHLELPSHTRRIASAAANHRCSSTIFSLQTSRSSSGCWLCMIFYYSVVIPCFVTLSAPLFLICPHGDEEAVFTVKLNIPLAAPICGYLHSLYPLSVTSRVVICYLLIRDRVLLRRHSRLRLTDQQTTCAGTLISTRAGEGQTVPARGFARKAIILRLACRKHSVCVGSFQKQEPLRVTR